MSKRLSWYAGLTALLAAVTLGAQAQPLTGGLLGRSSSGSTVPAGCVATSVPFFLGSPLALGCDAGLTYDANSLRAQSFGTDSRSTDAAPYTRTVTGQSAWSHAATNTTGAPLVLAGGIGRRYYTILGNTGLNAKVFNLFPNLLGTTLTAGTSFALGSDDTAPQLAVTATNLAAAINGNATLGALVTATAVGAVVYVEPLVGLTSLNLYTSAGAGEAVATQGNSGGVRVADSVGAPSLSVYGGLFQALPTVSIFPGVAQTGKALQVWDYQGTVNALSVATEDGRTVIGPIAAPNTLYTLSIKAPASKADTVFYVEAPNNVNHLGFQHNGTRGWLYTDGDLIISASEDLEFHTFDTGVGYSTKARISNEGGLQLISETRPTCDATRRGTFWYVAGGAGAADTIEICGKAAADTYSWVALATF